MADEKRRKEFTDLDQSLDNNRLPPLPWTLLLLPYLPVGLFLTVLRLCTSLQAFVLLVVFPEGAIKRLLLRIFFGVLGVFVKTEGLHRKGSYTRMYIANRLSYVDNVALHLALNCTTVSTGDRSPPLSALLPHHTFTSEEDSSLESEAKEIPELNEDESVEDYTPYAFQPEATPTNGSHVLRFSSWPFALNCVLQPVAVSAWRPFGIKVTTTRSSGWWDLIWTLFVPFTVYNIRMLPALERDVNETTDEFSRRVQQAIADELHVRKSQATKTDYEDWLADQQPPTTPATPQHPPPSAESATSASPPPSEFDSMVQQVTIVLPQVPRAAIRNDLKKTGSVDATITNLLEGKVPYNPLPLEHNVPTSQPPPPPASLHRRIPQPSSSHSSIFGKNSQISSRITERRSSGSKRGMFSANSSSPALSSMQRHLSLEERKRNLLEEARRRYIEKHGLL